jgi:mersacidin/lichenicidin family type 2 lantibiotic
VSHPNDSKKKIVMGAIALGSLAANNQIQLTIEEIVRAWESPEFRQTLTAEQLNQLPPNPAGDVEFHIPTSNEKTIEVASTQYVGCATQYVGCATQYVGCATQYVGCATQYVGCSTQFENCMA